MKDIEDALRQPAERAIKVIMHPQCNGAEISSIY